MSVPIIDFKSESVLDEIRKAYTTVGFAVFTNTLTSEDKKTMDNWFKTMKDFSQKSQKKSELVSKWSFCGPKMVSFVVENGPKMVFLWSFFRLFFSSSSELL